MTLLTIVFKSISFWSKNFIFGGSDTQQLDNYVNDEDCGHENTPVYIGPREGLEGGRQSSSIAGATKRVKAWSKSVFKGPKGLNLNKFEFLYIKILDLHYNYKVLSYSILIKFINIKLFIRLF